MRNILVLVLGLCLGWAAVAWCQQKPVAAAPPEQMPPLMEFKVLQIRFDESNGAKKPTPRIPVDWKFIGVANGSKMNCNNLWFQNGDGELFCVEGFWSRNEFVLNEYIGKLARTSR